MEFKSLNNIESSFKQLRLFSIIFLCLCAGKHIVSQKPNGKRYTY